MEKDATKKVIEDKDGTFGDIMIMALRYALGRRTYVTNEVPDFIKNSLENEENSEKIVESSEKTTENEENNNVSSKNELVNEEPVQNENQSKEQEIKDKLGLIKSSLLLKNLKEKEKKTHE